MCACACVRLLCVCLYAREYARCVRHAVHVQPRNRQAQAQLGPARRRCSNRIFIYAWELDRPRLVAFGALPARASCRWLRGGALAAYPYISTPPARLGRQLGRGRNIFSVKAWRPCCLQVGPWVTQETTARGHPPLSVASRDNSGPLHVLERRSIRIEPSPGTNPQAPLVGGPHAGETRLLCMFPVIECDPLGTAREARGRRTVGRVGSRPSRGGNSGGVTRS